MTQARKPPTNIALKSSGPVIQAKLSGSTLLGSVMEVACLTLDFLEEHGLPNGSCLPLRVSRQCKNLVDTPHDISTLRSTWPTLRR